MGGKTSTSTQSVSIPPEVLARYNAVNTRAEETAQRPFQQYSSDPNAFVAPLSQTQQAGIAGTNAAAGAAQPYYQAATGMAMQGAGPTNVGQLTGKDIGYYMNPFVENVAQPTSQLLRQQQEQQMSGQTGNAIRAGAFGGDRAGIAAANLAGQQSLAFANAINPLYSQAYQQGLGTAQQQQGFNLGQQQANLQRAGQGAQAIAGLGAGAQQAALQGAAAQMQAGQQQQQTEQAGKQALYNQFLQQQGYPFQVAQFLANIAMGTGALSGSTTTTTQPTSFFSDRRLKHDIHRIGETDDGLPIYKFKYKGDPAEQTHIGFMAQDVEKKKPEAVGLAGGYKTVDYDRATRASGGLVPSSMGGIVYEDYAGEGFADGGMPQLDIFGGGLSRIPASVLAQMQNSPRRSLMTPSMGLKPQSTGFADMMGEAQKALAAGDTLKKLYEGGSKAYDWIQGKAGGGSVDPYDPDQSRPDFMTSVLREGKVDTGALPKPGQLTPPKSGMSELSDIASTVAKIIPFFLKNGGGVKPRHGYALDGAVEDPDLPAIGAQEAGLVTNFKIPEEYAPIIERASRETGIPAAIIAAKIKRESSFDPSATGKSGEIGLAQILPSTARDPGYGLEPAKGNLRDPENNIMFGARYLAGRGRAAGVKDWEDPAQAAKALAAYNSSSRAPQYARDVLALVRNDAGEPMASRAPAGGVVPAIEGETRPPSRMGLSGRPGVLSETPENAPFRTLFGGALEGQGLKPSTKAALTSENFWVPLISGVGSMLGSPSITLGGAIGHGLMGGAKAYTDLQKQQAETEARKAGIEETGAKTISTESDTLQRSLQTLPNGLNIVWLANGKPMLYGDYDDLRKAGKAPPLMGNKPRNADQIAEQFLRGKSGEPVVEPPAAPKAPEPPATGKPEPADPFKAPALEPQKPAPGVGFDEKSVEKARQDLNTSMSGGPAAENAKKVSDNYVAAVTASGNAARESSRFITELAENLSNAVQGKGLDAPGAGYDARAQVIGALNTFGRAFGLPDSFGSSDSIKQINEKISALQAAAQTKGAGQESYAALALLKNAIANPKMAPRAFTKLSADLMAQNQRAIDRYNHYELYSQASRSNVPGAASDFERLNSDAKYNKESAALANLILRDPQLIKEMREGKHSAAEIDKAFKKGYGVDGMSRYFIGGR